MSFLLLITIVALGFSHLVQSQNYSKLKNEHEKLKKDLGFLEVKDPDVIYAIGLPLHGCMSRRYRLYLPPNKNYEFRFASKEIPKDGFDVPAYFHTKVPPGMFANGLDELWIELSNTHVHIHYRNSGWSINDTFGVAPEGKVAFNDIDDITPMSTREGVKGKPFLIERQRKVYFPLDTKVTTDDFPEWTDGIMLWIEEVP